MIGRVDSEVVAFDGDLCVAAGRLDAVVRTLAPHSPDRALLILDEESGHPVEVDWRGSIDEIVSRLPVAPPRGPGRPKLGVRAREVTLLPRHWDWLSAQPGGASITLRRLVETASRDPRAAKKEVEAKVYRHLSALAGDRPGFEEASRALFGGDRSGFETRTRNWPPNIRDHARRQAARVFDLLEAG